MFSNKELIERGKHYFEKKEIKVMYATADGNFFYAHSKVYAIDHAAAKGLKVITITRAGVLTEPTEAAKAAPVEKVAAKAPEVETEAKAPVETKSAPKKAKAKPKAKPKSSSKK